MIEPSRIAFLGHTITDECRAGRAQSNQLVGINRDVAGVLAAEVGIVGTVLEKVAGHPVILSRTGQIFDCFSPVAAMQLGTSFTRGTNKDYSESGVVCHCHQRGFTVSRYAFDPYSFGIDRLVRLQVIQSARGSPRPCAKRTPIVRLPRLAFIDESDNALRQAGAVVGLNTSRIDRCVTPTIGN